MAKGRGRAGTHTTVTDAARPVAEALEKLGRVSRGKIDARIGAKTFSIKITPLDGCLLVVVVSKGTRQELRAYGISVAQAEQALRQPEFASYHLNVARE
jgi:hypothetical protein